MNEKLIILLIIPKLAQYEECNNTNIINRVAGKKAECNSLNFEFNYHKIEKVIESPPELSPSQLNKNKNCLKKILSKSYIYIIIAVICVEYNCSLIMSAPDAFLFER